MTSPDSEQNLRTGRPLGFQRDSSIDAAMQLFWKRGVLPVSSKDLAEAMGIQRSSFYNSFGSKQAVFSEALQRYGAIAPDRRLDAIQHGQPVVAQIVSFLRELCEVRAKDPEGRGCLVCNGIAELAGTKSEAGEQMQKMVQTRIRRMQNLFTQARSQGELTTHQDPNDMARSFVAFMIGLNTLSKVVRSKQQLWDTCRSYLHGLGIEAD